MTHLLAFFFVVASSQILPHFDAAKIDELRGCTKYPAIFMYARHCLCSGGCLPDGYSSGAIFSKAGVPSRSSSSCALCPRSGCFQPGAISANGCSTKSRRCMRG